MHTPLVRGGDGASQAVMKMPKAVDILSELQSKHARMERITNLLASALMTHLGSHTHCRFLQQLIEEVSVGKRLHHHVAHAALDLVSRSSAQAVLRYLSSNVTREAENILAGTTPEVWRQKPRGS